jgi:hypothetical protein
LLWSNQDFVGDSIMTHEEIHTLAWRILGGATFALAWIATAILALA